MQKQKMLIPSNLQIQQISLINFVSKPHWKFGYLFLFLTIIYEKENKLQWSKCTCHIYKVEKFMTRKTFSAF